ncbi:hypothetical protein METBISCDRAFT_22680 [Metschnikowia bicuspidata]|uniref:Ubiquitin-like domain-containing protein n=1 Tax=Metschnikowia bicuspidata TaxID=27322 RepID=A0A4P9ZFB0_9ASCO|nr:hypothetical protein METBISCDRAFT_25148 [Metschnikowia bicuspidata]RKP31132.1 hypothetical protein METBISCDRAFT_22680 [Metschnikowia bicuspidata]
MDRPFTLSIRKVHRAPNSSTSLYRLRTTLNHTLNHVIELAMLQSAHNADADTHITRPVLMLDGEDVAGDKTLADVLQRDCAEGEVYGGDLVLVCDAGGSSAKIPVPEYFDIDVAPGSGAPVFSCRVTLYSTVGELTMQISEKFKFNLAQIMLLYHDEPLLPESTLLDVLVLDVPPINRVRLGLEHSNGPSAVSHAQILASDPIWQHKNPAEQLAPHTTSLTPSETYTFTANGRSVDLSTLDCILIFDRAVLLNSYAQQLLKAALHVPALEHQVPSEHQQNTSSSSPTGPPRPPGRLQHPPSFFHSPDSNSGTAMLESANQPETPGNNEEHAENEINLNDGATAAGQPHRPPFPRNGPVAQRLLREITTNVDEIAQLLVRLALASALIGPERALFIFQPPLVYLFIAFTLWAWLCFYGDVISAWIEERLLQNAPQNRMDYTLANLVAQIFQETHNFTMLMSNAMSACHTFLAAKVHYDRPDLARVSGLVGTAKVTAFATVEFVLVLVSSTFPFLGAETQRVRDHIALHERQKIQGLIKEALETRASDEGIRSKLLVGVGSTLESLLLPDLAPEQFQDLVRCYYNAAQL